jgi:protein-tyrosine phosphatase
VPRPRGNDWLEDEIQAWRGIGLSAIVSALTAVETMELELGREAEICAAAGLEYVSFPIEDRGVPRSVSDAIGLVRHCESKLAEGAFVGVHCRQGVGRSALLSASLLVAAGESPEGAFRRIATARGCPVPDTLQQAEWVAKLVQVFKQESHDSAGVAGARAS